LSLRQPRLTCRELDLPVVRSQQRGEARLPRPPPLSVYRLSTTGLVLDVPRAPL
jgi:hypothetical protein